jgi:uncharacterized protein (DUF2141 family)
VLPIKSISVGLLLAAAATSTAPVGPYADACIAGARAVLVQVNGVRTATGTIVVKLYRSEQSSYLGKGTYLVRVEVPVQASGDLAVCLPVAASGRYLVSVRHVIAKKKSQKDGGGLSGNPSISVLDLLLSRKPALASVSFDVEEETSVVNVTLNYLQNGSFRPVRNQAPGMR